MYHHNIHLLTAKLCRIMNEHLEEVVFLKVSFETNKDMVSQCVCHTMSSGTRIHHTCSP